MYIIPNTFIGGKGEATVAATVAAGNKAEEEDEGVVDFFFPFDTKDFLCFK